MIDAFRIGVALNLTSNASGMLNVLAKDFLGLKGHISATMAELTRVQVAIAGLGAVAVGSGILVGMKHLIDHGETLVHQQELFRASLKDSGMTAQQIAIETAKVTAAAWQNTRDVLGTTAAENLQSIRELRMVFGGEGANDPAATKRAIENLPAVTKAQMILESIKGSGGGDQVFAMAKAAEMRGDSMDPAKFTVLLNDMVKAAIASGGRVLGTDFLNTFKYGRTAALGWSETFIASILPTLIQEMKSGSGSGGVGGPGNALMSAYQEVVGGVMSNKAAEEFYKLHLLDPHKIIRTKTGHIKGVLPGGVAGSAEFINSPYNWIQDFLVPALHAQAAKEHVSADKMQGWIQEQIAHAFGNRTAQQIMTMFATQQVRFQKDAAVNAAAGGLDVYNQNVNTDPTMVLNKFQAAWTNLMTAFGAPAVPIAMTVMTNVTNVVNTMSKIATEHPGAVKVIETVLIGLGAFLVVAGSAMVAGSVLSFIVGGSFAAAIAVTAAGMASLAAVLVSVNWKDLWDAFLAPIRWLRDQLATADDTKKQLQANPPGSGDWKKLRDWFGFGPPGSGPGPDLNERVHPGYKNQSYDPGSGAPIVHLTVKNYVDGREMASQVIRTIVDRASGAISGIASTDGRRIYSTAQA